MRTWSILLVWIVASATSSTLPSNPNPRLSLMEEDKAPPPSAMADEVHAGSKLGTNQPARKQSENTDGGTNQSNDASLPTPVHRHTDRAESDKRVNQPRDKGARRTRKHKAFFRNHHRGLQPRYNAPYNVPYNMDQSFEAMERRVTDTKDAHRESDIFYVRLPPTPYMFVPGLGYVSHPPKYSTNSLRPQIPHTRPSRPRPPAFNTQQKQQQQQQQQPQPQSQSQRQPVDPFIKVPIDFVSNGKPTSVYKWQKRPSVTDSPITNLNNLSPNFVINGKPTSVYQWQTNVNSEEDDSINQLDRGPYWLNGKFTRVYLLGPDGSTSPVKPILAPDYKLVKLYH